MRRQVGEPGVDRLRQFAPRAAGQHVRVPDLGVGHRVPRSGMLAHCRVEHLDQDPPAVAARVGVPPEVRLCAFGEDTLLVDDATPGPVDPDHAVAERKVDELGNPGLSEAKLERGIAQVGSRHVAERGAQAQPDAEEVARVGAHRRDGIDRRRQVGSADLRVMAESAGREDDATPSSNAHYPLLGFDDNPLDAAVAAAEDFDYAMPRPDVDIMAL